MVSRISFSRLQLVLHFGSSSIHALVPISKVALRLLQLNCIQVSLRRAVGNLTPLILYSGTVGALKVRLATTIRIYHIDLGKVILELLNWLHSILLYHIIHLVVIIAWWLHVTHIRVSSEGFSWPWVIISCAHVILDLLHVLSRPCDAWWTDVGKLKSWLALISVQAYLMGHILPTQMWFVSWLIIPSVVSLDRKVLILKTLHLFLRSLSIHYQLLLPGSG